MVVRMIPIIIDQEVRTKRGGIMATLRWFTTRALRDAAQGEFARKGYYTQCAAKDEGSHRWGLYCQYRELSQMV